MANGRATLAEMQQLWRNLLESLLERVKATKRPPTDLMQVARKFLRDQGFSAPDEAARNELAVLYGLYSKALHDALTDPSKRPSSATLSEARHFLTWHGLRPDIEAGRAAEVVKKISELQLPFTTKH